MTLHAIRVDDVRPQPWRNGGGLTRELLTWPSAQAWGIRISVAEVTRDGPFSAFPGVERWFAVLDGAGVTLAFGDAGDDVHSLHQGDPPLHFDGARPAQCSLIGGPTRDLNVMSVRRRGRATCTAARADAALASRADLRAVFAAEGGQLVHRKGTLAIDAMTLVWSTEAKGERWRVAGEGRAWWIEFMAGEHR